MGKEGLICAYLFDGKGRGKVLGWEGIRAWKPEDGVIWVHVNLESPEAKRWVERESQLEELIGDAILAQDARAASDAPWGGDDRGASGGEHESGGRSRGHGGDPDVAGAAADRCRAARRRLIAVEDLGKWLENGEGPNDAGEFAVNLAWRLIERMDPVMDTLTEAVDEIEDAILSQKEDPTYRARLADLRRDGDRDAAASGAATRRDDSAGGRCGGLDGVAPAVAYARDQRPADVSDRGA